MFILAWGISPKAPPREKIKAEMNDFLMGYNSCGIIDYSTYSEMYDFTMELLDRMYAQGMTDGKIIDDAIAKEQE